MFNVQCIENRVVVCNSFHLHKTNENLLCFVARVTCARSYDWTGDEEVQFLHFYIFFRVVSSRIESINICMRCLQFTLTSSTNCSLCSRRYANLLLYTVAKARELLKLFFFRFSLLASLQAYIYKINVRFLINWTGILFYQNTISLCSLLLFSDYRWNNLQIEQMDFIVIISKKSNTHSLSSNQCRHIFYCIDLIIAWFVVSRSS